MTRNYGTCPDVPDHRDHHWEAARSTLRALPRRVDLRRLCPPVYDQGHLNSCSAHALAAAIWFVARKHHPAALAPSRMFIYYNERSMEKRPRCNVPVSLRDGYKSVTKVGACAEHQWRYTFRNFSRRPPKQCYEHALQRRVDRYARVVRELDQMKASLVNGLPFTMGMSVYETFEHKAVKRTGVVPMPKDHERMLGGHAVMVVGYDDALKSLIVRNSWGPKWGQGGYFLLPYDYVLSHKHYAWDFWTILELTHHQPQAAGPRH
jgi:C1A family cysteine protease